MSRGLLSVGRLAVTTLVLLGACAEPRRAAPVDFAADLALASKPSVVPNPVGRWVQVNRDSSGMLFLDTASVAREPDGNVLVWVRWDYRVQRKDEHGRWYASQMDRSTINCRDLRFAILESVRQNTRGSVVSSQDLSDVTRWTSAPPMSVGEIAFRQACALAATRG